MRKVSSRGLVDAPAEERRLSVAVMYGEQPSMSKMLIDTWAAKTPQEAYNFLARPEYGRPVLRTPRRL